MLPMLHTPYNTRELTDGLVCPYGHVIRIKKPRGEKPAAATSTAMWVGPLLGRPPGWLMRGARGPPPLVDVGIGPGIGPISSPRTSSSSSPLFDSPLPLDSPPPLISRIPLSLLSLLLPLPPPSSVLLILPVSLSHVSPDSWGWDLAPAGRPSPPCWWLGCYGSCSS